MNYLVTVALLLALYPARSFTQELPLADTNKPVHLQSTVAPSSPEKIWSDLIAGNKRFIAGGTKVQQLTKLRKSLVKGQHPQAAVLSCSDSRVPPEILFDQSLGNMFVVRSAGNVADAIAVGSLEYAVEHLGTTVLIILGHEHCGAVTAACAVEKPSSPNLRVIMDKIYPSVAQARNYSEKEALIDSAILENIHESARDVLAQSEVLRHAFKEGKLTIIEAIYSLESGEVRRLGKLSLIPPAYKLDVGDVVRVQ
jgi:carbonic anhydrase